MKFSPKAVLLDAYGTLFDVYSVRQTAEALFPGQGEALSKMWRDKQVEYTRLRSMAGRYKTFWEITQDALTYCGAALGLPLSPDHVDLLMAQYRRLSAFPENLQALQRMRQAGYPLAIHSNGNPEMIASAVQSAGMSDLFEVVLSADQVRRYKIDPQVYQLAIDHFRQPAKDMLFVSSNGWDVGGATWFGFTTFWVNRAGLPVEALDVMPSFTGRNLTDVADAVCV
jgi:2-haloacid dehalogenase